jgi:hypothetical protein
MNMKNLELQMIGKQTLQSTTASKKTTFMMQYELLLQILYTWREMAFVSRELECDNNYFLESI